MRSWCVTGPHDAERREQKRLGRPVCIRGRGRCEYRGTIFTFAPSSTAEGDLGVRSDWFATATRTEVSGPRRSDRARSDLARAGPPAHLGTSSAAISRGDGLLCIRNLISCLSGSALSPTPPLHPFPSPYTGLIFFSHATLCIEGTIDAREALCRKYAQIHLKLYRGLCIFFAEDEH
jgi:hypothetical protein